MMNDPDPEVARAISAWPADVGDRFFLLWQLLLDEVSLDEAVGEIGESLKWGEPTYLTTSSGSG